MVVPLKREAMLQRASLIRAWAPETRLMGIFETGSRQDLYDRAANLHKRRLTSTPYTCCSSTTLATMSDRLYQ